MKSDCSSHAVSPTGTSSLGENSMQDSKLVLAENGRGVSDFRLTYYKQSDDSHLNDEQQLLYLTRVYQPQRSRCFLPGFQTLRRQAFIMSGDMERTCFMKFTM
ncbi:hypothetical protein TNCV_4143871 [Trichonephila clavipes]|nr:hypothetical protein TNCV_4143871 [Trichonephila clavipes]